MISTVTTTTIELFSMTTKNVMSLFAIMTLIILVIQYEIASGITDPRARRLRGALAAPIVPLAIVLLSIVALRIAAFWN
jgi:hypothetical protein